MSNGTVFFFVIPTGQTGMVYSICNSNRSNQNGPFYLQFQPVKLEHLAKWKEHLDHHAHIWFTMLMYGSLCLYMVHHVCAWLIMPPYGSALLTTARIHGPRLLSIQAPLQKSRRIKILRVYVVLQNNRLNISKSLEEMFVNARTV